MRIKLPKLPQLIDRKIYKTGQTRGADDDVIYQNRVSRASTVLIPYSVWEQAHMPPNGDKTFENGFIVLISPEVYFGTKYIDIALKARGLKLGSNTLIFYETREQWEKYNPRKMGYVPAKNRVRPLGGEYVARIPATTALKKSGKIVEGYHTTSNKGAGIRVYEYASSDTIKKSCVQLEVLFWFCIDSKQVVISNGMTDENAEMRKREIIKIANELGLIKTSELKSMRMIDKNSNTICPLCLEQLSANGFFNKMLQAEGREVPDLTVTQVNLFHINELRIGLYNHRPYNLCWGHHHCNVVVKDAGINNTLSWLKSIIQKNEAEGYKIS